MHLRFAWALARLDADRTYVEADIVRGDDEVGVLLHQLLERLAKSRVMFFGVWIRPVRLERSLDPGEVDVFIVSVGDLNKAVDGTVEPRRPARKLWNQQNWPR